MRKMRTIVAAVCCLVCLQLLAAPPAPKEDRQNEPQESVATSNRLGAYVLAGYDNLLKNDRRLQNIGGPMGGLGLAYQLEHGTYSRGAFLFNLGVEARYGLNIRKGYFDITQRMRFPTDEMFTGYRFRNIREQQTALDVAAAIMFGGKYKGFFVMAGAKLAYPLMVDYSIKSDVEKVIYDAQAIDYYTDMPNHNLLAGQASGSGRLANRFNPMVSLELGYDFHKPSSQPKSKGKGQQKQKRSFKDYGHCQLSAFVDVGVMNYTPDNMPQFCDLGNEADIRLSSTSEAVSFASARMIPFFAGLKFAVLFDLPGKKQKKETAHYPSILTFVSDETTGRHIAGATVTTQSARKKKKPVVRTTDSKHGRVAKSYAPGKYIISATHPDYFPVEPVKITHRDMDDTVRIALYPKHSLRTQVVDARTGRLVMAHVSVLDEGGDIIATTALDSAAQTLSALVDNRRTYTVCANAEGYRDTCVTVRNVQDMLFVQLEPVKVRRFVLKDLYFATNKTNILPSSEAALQELFLMLDENPEKRILIIGHTDNVGKDDYNQRLSEGRAESVKQEMVKRGIAPTRIRTIGRGEKDPIVANDSDEHRQMNRRVEIEILK